jgi:2',3'-cyclic-nucleotide 2'-phosphodiesterase (5'-nucleotidase family)
MYLNIKQFVLFVTIIFFTSCGDRDYTISKISGNQLLIEQAESSAGNDSLQNFLQPYISHVNSVLDKPLCYAPYDIGKNDGRYNSSAGNLLADIILQQAGPVFESRTNEKIDFVVLNHGGIRSAISMGDVSSRTAYEVMPFENTVVVVQMKGKAIRDLVSHLIRSSRPHPIGGLQIIIDKKDQLSSVSIQGEPFDENRTYNVATSDYLFNGGDNMGFFKDGMQHYELEYFIRNAMIDYFEKVDTLRAGVDDRFLKLDTP